MPLTPENAAIILQKNFRMFQARKTYGVDTKNYDDFINKIYMVGNDPQMPASLDTYNVPDDRVAIVGTSGLRSLAIACKLGNETLTPKLIIVDISKNVCDFWRELRDIFIKDRETSALTPESFLLMFERLARKYDENIDRSASCDKLTSQIHKDSTYIKSNPISYMRALLNKYGYHYIRSIILNTSIVGNSWSSEKNTQKIKHILDHLGIKHVFVYVSNIYFVIAKNERGELLKAIQLLEPTLTIQTNLCIEHKIPSKVMLFTPKHSQEDISTTLKDAVKCPNDPAINDARFSINFDYLDTLSECLNLNKKDVFDFRDDYARKNQTPTTFLDPYDFTKKLIRQFNLNESRVKLFVKQLEKIEMRHLGFNP